MTIDENAPYARQMLIIERQMLEFAIETADGDWVVAAQRLGISRLFLRKRAYAVGIASLEDPPGTFETPKGSSRKKAKAGRKKAKGKVGRSTSEDEYSDARTLANILRNPPALSEDGRKEFADFGPEVPS
jgi:hypothetical protein